jgi:hypothetical protein
MAGDHPSAGAAELNRSSWQAFQIAMNAPAVAGACQATTGTT